MVQGLSHMTFIVEDLDRMERFLTTVFDARKVYDSGDETFSLSKERFFLIGEEDREVWVATMEGEKLTARSYNHVAFKIDEADFDDYRQRIEALGIDIRESRSRVEGEGRSVYFLDHANHMFELHTGTLDERLARYPKGRAGEGG